jgi:glycosyltransferase involved in cell wall biosynthesis
MEARIAVIIPTRNRGKLIENTLHSIQANTIQDLEVWVVDQSDDLTTANVVESFLKRDGRFSLISSKTKGVNVARNIGIKASSAPIIAFTDDDCRVADNWLEALLSEYEAYPDVDSIFGRIITDNTSTLVTQNDQTANAQIQRLRKMLPMAQKVSLEHKLFMNNRFNLGFGHGANMSFRRSAFEKFGLFDEFMGAGAPLRSWPERDIGYRILAGGGQILYSPVAYVHHDHWRQWKEVRNTFRNYGLGAGAAVGKYLRVGDWASIWLLIDWMLQHGVRQMLSGIFKWRSWQKTYIGLLQLVYPWVGLLLSMQYKIDRQQKIYVGK